MKRPRGFTLVELLVVVAIIVALLAILLPSMGKAMTAAVRATCGAQLHQIHLGAMSYASDSFGSLPSRAPAYYPHQTKDFIATPAAWDLNESFIIPYLTNRNTLMFCPSSLLDVRNPWDLPTYAVYYMTYQYTYAPSWSGCNWLVAQPRLGKLSTAPNSVTLWACQTVKLESLNYYFGHDAPATAAAPQGANGVRIDGGAAWSDFKTQMEAYMYRAGDQQRWYWPRPD